MNESALEKALRDLHSKFHSDGSSSDSDRRGDYPAGLPESARPYWNLISRYFPVVAQREAAFILDCESGGNPRAHNTKNEDSRGLFQVNVGPGGNTDMVDQDLFDPETNIKSAAQIYGYWNSWYAWFNCATKFGFPASPKGR